MDSSRQPYWEISQTNAMGSNVDNVNVSYVNKTSNHLLLIIGRPTIYTHTKNFKVYAFGCDSIHVILFMRAFDGMLTASPGRQRQRDCTHATRRCFRDTARQHFAALIAMRRAH